MNLSPQIEAICRSQLFQGKKAKEIHRHLLDSNHQVTYRNVLTFVKQEHARKSGETREYKSTILGNNTKRVQEIVKATYQTDKRQSERQVRAVVSRVHGIVLSRSVLQSLKKAVNFKTYSPISVPSIKPAQAVKRLAMVQNWIDNRETFDHWVFSDECSLALTGNCLQITTDDPHDPARLLAKQQFPEKVAVWGSISRLGKGALVFLNKMERLKDHAYLDILETHLLPYIDSTYGRSVAVYMQDGARCHTSKRAMDTMKNQWGLTVADWAPSSPDLNPIEYVWRELKLYIEWEKKPTTRQELIEGIEEFWSTKVTSEMCNLYFDHCLENARAVKKADGNAIVDSSTKHAYN